MNTILEPKQEQVKPEIPVIKPPNPHTTLLDDDKNTILHYSAAKGQSEHFTKKIKYEELNLENYLGWTPLMMACRNKHLSTVKLLLELGGDATKKNKFGMSVFHISVAGGCLEIVKIILENLLTGGISKRIMQNIFSPISMAILFRNHDILDFLIKQNFNLDAVTPVTGITPLMFAAAMEDTFAHSLLIQNKGDTSIKNHLQATVEDIKKGRYNKQETSKKLTPAELISRSPHMAPSQCFISPHPSFTNSPLAPFVCIRKSSDTLSPNPAVFVTTPGITPIAPMSVPQVFFPPQFSPGQFMTVGTVPSMFTGTIDYLNMRINPNQGDFMLSPSVN